MSDIAHTRSCPKEESEQNHFLLEINRALVEGRASSCQRKANDEEGGSQLLQRLRL